jgi:protein-disulfide isomerase
MPSKDMNDEKTNQSLSKNDQLAADPGITGTAAYIIGTQLVPGAIDAESLANIVAAERAKLSVAQKVAETSTAQ